MKAKGATPDGWVRSAAKTNTANSASAAAFKDKDRDNPPKIGAVITYRYRGFTQKGTPKFATFVRVRTDR